MNTSIFQEMDKWAYDLEIEYKKNGFSTPKQRKQYINICAIRDKFYEKYLENIRELNSYSNGVRHCSMPKCCDERMKPPKPPGNQYGKGNKNKNEEINKLYVEINVELNK